MGSIGNVLGDAVLDNEDIKEAFQRILHGEEAPGEELLGFKDAREIMPEGDALDKEYMAWAEKEEAAKRPSDTDTFSSSYVEKKTGNKKGFWADITQKFIKGLLEI